MNEPLTPAPGRLAPPAQADSDRFDYYDARLREMYRAAFATPVALVHKQTGQTIKTFPSVAVAWSELDEMPDGMKANAALGWA